MNKDSLPYLLLFIFSIFIASVSQILLKKSANKTHQGHVSEYLNGYVLGAYGLFLGSTLMTVLAYKQLSLSLGPILESLGYVFVLIMGSVFLNEKIQRHHLIGFVFIVVGILVFTLGKT